MHCFILVPNYILNGQVKLEDDDYELEKKISLKTQKLKKPVISSKPEDIALAIKQETENARSDRSGAITLNSMAEFCRTLGDIPTYGQAGNRDENTQEFMVGLFHA